MLTSENGSGCMINPEMIDTVVRESRHLLRIWGYSEVGGGGLGYFGDLAARTT